MTTTLPESKPLNRYLVRDEVVNIVHSYKKSDWMIVYFLIGGAVTMHKDRCDFEAGDTVNRHVINGINVLTEKI